MDKSIKSIVVIAGNYPAPGHAALVFVQQLVHAIIDMGVKVTVIAPQSIVHTIVHKKPLLPKHSKVTTERGYIYDVHRPYTLSFGKNNLFSTFTSHYNRHKIEKLLVNINTDALYTHFWGSTALVYKYALKNKLPLFVACGESGDLFASELRHFSVETKEKMSKAVTGIISVSAENKRKCIEYSLGKAENIEVLPNAIQADRFYRADASDMKNKLGINNDDFVIAFVGAFISRKGPDRVAKAIIKLNDPQIKVIFIGKPFDGNQYDFDCPGIIHKGPLDHSLLPQYLNCADVFVLPTRNEGCCNAIVEALAMGIPVISSEGAFNDDILNENNSIRINPNDVDAIAEAIRKLKENPELRKKMSDYSQSRHEDYSIKGRAKKILDFINRKITE